MINPEVFLTLDKNSKQRDKTLRQKTNLLAASLRPLCTALDDILKIKGEIAPNEHEKQVIQTSWGEVDITKVWGDLASGIQLLSHLYFSGNVQRKAALKNSLNPELWLLTTSASKFSEGLLFGDDIHGQLQNLSRMSRVGFKLKPRIRPHKSRPYDRTQYMASKNFYGLGRTWSPHHQQTSAQHQYQQFRGHNQQRTQRFQRGQRQAQPRFRGNRPRTQPNRGR